VSLSGEPSDQQNKKINAIRRWSFVPFLRRQQTINSITSIHTLYLRLSNLMPQSRNFPRKQIVAAKEACRNKLLVVVVGVFLSLGPLGTRQSLELEVAVAWTEKSASTSERKISKHPEIQNSL
jgi:hypothetical protein